MSKTVEELQRDFRKAFIEAKGSTLSAERAGIAAVVRALRGVIDQAYSEGRASKVRGDNENVQRQWVDALINEILGDAGNDAARKAYWDKHYGVDETSTPTTDPAPVNVAKMQRTLLRKWRKAKEAQR